MFDHNLLFCKLLDWGYPLVILRFFGIVVWISRVLCSLGVSFRIRLVSPTSFDKEAFYLFIFLQCSYLDDLITELAVWCWLLLGYYVCWLCMLC